MEDFEKECWLEVELQRPKGWFLAAESGGVLDGYFRIDSKESVKLEVKWEKQTREKRVKTKVQPMIVINGFIENYMRKSKKRDKAEVYGRGNIEICSHNAYFVRWQADTETVTSSWVCENEKKVFLLNYYLEPNEEWENVVSWLIPGLVCHTPEEFWKYRLSGVEFKVAKGYALQNRKLLLGRPALVFKNKDKTLLIHWSYFAKETLFKYKGSLLEWSKKEIPKEVHSFMKGLSYNKLKSDEKTGKLVMEDMVRGAALIRRAVKTMRIWHDSDSNRIFLVGYLGPKEDTGDLEELEASIKFELD